MIFSKLQATGNDFILIDARSLGALSSEAPNLARLARDLCQHHFGIGADGLILVQDSELADVKMRMLNPDGSEAEACGNGLRCFVKYVIENGIVHKTDLDIETLSGIRIAKARLSRERVREVQVSMGIPQFKPEQIPIDAQVDITPILDYPLAIGGRTLALSILSLGNPHAVTFVSEPVAGFPLVDLGRKVEEYPIFPRRTNFEIARVLSNGKIEARVWERGVGETLACGSGACAIAVAAQLIGHTGRQVDIAFPGGNLIVYWDRVGEVLLSGPVEEVFKGESRTLGGS
jgi:diaminopimelate epimerase